MIRRRKNVRVRGATISILLCGVLASGCGNGDPPAAEPLPDAPPPDVARHALAAAAAAAQDRVGVSSYTLTSQGHPERTVSVLRAEDGSWRVDVPGGALGGAADVVMVSIDGQLYQCAAGAGLPSPTGAGAPGQPAGASTPVQPGCVAVTDLPAAADPRVHRLFSDWLDVFTDRSAAVAVAAVDPLAEVSDDSDCFAVGPRAAGLVAAVDAGVYCYRADGALTGAQLPLGTLTLRETSPDAPESVTLPGPVVDGDPLPTSAPSPSAASAPSPSATSAPAGSPHR